MREAVFLDRDGMANKSVVQNGKSHSAANLAAFEILLGVSESVVRLRKAGLLVIVATNQPDIETGVQHRDVVEEMHSVLVECVPVGADRMSVHVGADGCNCSKPKPGMLLEAAAEFEIDRSASFVVRDRWRDVVFGRAAGCRTFFINHLYAETLDLVDATSLILDPRRPH